ncbi:MAG: ExeM/NucH family extracellular endonuclease [Microbacterium sp.]|uniref:ExeM/NucH family extracellular endonuclease n=1 Tax=Microbacterium sp. TaxID=51671 RepID=UPI002607AAC1|nr:ExeM/NucH family extracellular endonuclease [Microbacterium sp.]MCX6502799.1 ExeM/NucH family extracellular endonuclease [Microbacterium sp.]
MFASQGRRVTARAAAATGAVLAAALLTPLPASAATPADVLINEAYLKGGSSGAPYLNKFIELYNAGETAQDLTGWSLQYRSATGTDAANAVVALSGTIQPGDYFLVQGAQNAANGAALPAADQVTSFNPGGQNGVVWLADTATALNPGIGDVAGAANVIDLIGYGAANTFETAAGPDAGGNSTPNSLVRTGFADTDDNAVDITVSTTVTPQASSGATPTPTPTPTETGSPSPTPTDTAAPSPSPTATAPADVTPIAAIQGSGDTSPLAGQTITARGVVTAAYPSGGFNGFYLQTPGTGGSEATTPGASDAVFVYGSSAVAKVAVGDHVEVTGAVSEYNGMTQISPTAANVAVLDEPADAVTPASVGWPTTDAAREALEGMLLAPQGAFTVSDTYDTNYYASIGLAAGTSPLLTPTEIAAPGTDAYDASVADNAARAVTLDDGASLNFNSAANKSIPLPYLSTTAPVRVGADVTFTQPVVLDYRNGLWNFQPTQQLTVANAAQVQPATFENTRTASPADVGGDIQIAGFNVLNYFPTTGEDAVAAGATCSYYNDRAGNHITVNTCTAGPGVRGAADDVNLSRQQAKIVAAINALDAEVVSLEEIENSTIAGEERDAAVATLVAALNADLGAEEWAYVPSPAAVPGGEDVIRTAFIYKVAAVEPVGDAVIDDDAAFDNARPPLAQAFTGAGGSPDDAFVAIVNHFKSKGSGTGADADTGDGQGGSNASRVAQAEALIDFSDAMQDTAGTDRVFLIGDFNAYTQEDPIRVLTGAGYVDQGSKTGKYTYSFDGAVGSLDHVLASPAADAAVTGVDIWNINSGESIALEYSRYNYNVTDFYDDSPYRSSDHDPIVVGVDLPDAAPDVTLNLLNINDFHGRIDANTVKFAGTVEQLRAQYGDENTLFLSGGDNIGASLFASAVAGDQPTLDVLDALDLRASGVGNHEFDQGIDDLLGRVSDEADFPYLGANVYTKGTTEPVLPEFATLEVDGLTVAVIGAVTEETASLVSPDGIADLEFGDPVEAVNRVAAALTDGNPGNGEADVLIAEYHEGAVDSASTMHDLDDELALGGAFAEIVTETSAAVDVIFTGHTHKFYAWDAPVPGTDRTRPIVQTGNYGENIGQVVLQLDGETGDVLSYTAGNVARTSADDATLAQTYPRVAEVKQIVDAALAAADEIGGRPIGSVTADITTAYTGGTSSPDGYTVPVKDGVPQGRDNRAAQSTLGNLVADSLVASLSAPERGGAQIGLVNPGGLRADLFTGADGVITYAEANAVLPFVNNLWTTTLTGAQFKDVLEEQWQPDGSSRPYLQLGVSANVSYTSDPSAPRGQRITGIWIDGQAIDPAASYRVGSFNFLLTGGDNFTTLAEGTDTRDSGLIDRDAWIAYLSDNSPVSPDFASRSAQVTGVPETVAAGATVTFTVAGLDLTSLGSPANSTLEAQIGDTIYPPIPVTNGSATVSITVPATASGPVEVLLTAPDSGTEVRVPITVLAQTGEPGGGLPGTGEPPVPGHPAPPAVPGVTAPVSALIAALQNAIRVLDQIFAGGLITIHVGTQYSGQWVAVWLRSDPVFLGWHQVDAAGNVSATLPAGVTGSHRLIVQDADGDVIGWQAVSIRALAATGGGGDAAGGMALLATLLLGAGATITVRSRRRRV